MAYLKVRVDDVNEGTKFAKIMSRQDCLAFLWSANFERCRI